MRSVSKITLAGVVILAIGATGCTSSGKSTAQNSALDANKKLQGQVHVTQNNVEFNNYNKRQEISDDPATILWCTAYLANPNVPPITYPIVGKLTSSGKRPYPTLVAEFGSSGSYNPELPGPDGMDGTSVEYRYGFTPGGAYVDFTAVSTVCTTQPTVYQATQTTIVLKTDAGLNIASTKAQQALKAGTAADGVISQAATDQAAAILQAQIDQLKQSSK